MVTTFFITAQFFDFFSRDRTFNSLPGIGGGDGGGSYGAPQQAGYGVPRAPVVNNNNRPSYGGGGGGINNNNRPSYGGGGGGGGRPSYGKDIKIQYE